MTQQEALKLAMEALEDISSHYMSLPKKGCMALAAIEEALAEQETVLPGGGHVPAVPVAVYGYCPECGGAGVMRERRPNGDDKCTNGHKYPSSKALAEQPAQQHDYWQEEARRYAQNADFWRGKYESATAQQQEPVAWRYKIVDCFGETVWTLKTPKTDTRVLESEPLYTSPPAQRKPLTDEEIDKLPWEPHEGNPMTFAEGLRYFARAIEAAHGIKE